LHKELSLDANIDLFMTIANRIGDVHLLPPGLNKETFHGIVLVWRQTTQ